MRNVPHIQLQQDDGSTLILVLSAITELHYTKGSALTIRLAGRSVVLRDADTAKRYYNALVAYFNDSVTAAELELRALQSTEMSAEAEYKKLLVHLYATMQRVTHDAFGAGTVSAILPIDPTLPKSYIDHAMTRGEYRVVADFERFGLKTVPSCSLVSIDGKPNPLYAEDLPEPTNNYYAR